MQKSFLVKNGNISGLNHYLCGLISQVKEMTDKPILAIVLPCYNEEEILSSTNEQLCKLINKMIGEKLISENSRLVYVDDGSKDKTWALIDQFCESNKRVCGVKLAGNSGHQNALMAGLDASLEFAHILITIDADLQDDINAIAQMVKMYNDEGCDIVYGVRKERKTDTWFKRTTAQGFYKLMQRLGVKSVYNHADFRLMSNRAVRQLMNYQERNLFLRGIVPLIGYKTGKVYYDRAERTAGESKYPLSKMLNFAIDGITSFSIRPVRMVLSIGFIFLFIALAMFVYVLYSYFSGHAVTGWSSMILSIWFVGGCILIGLGVVGEYIGKIYIEVKRRPRFNIEQKIIK